jgi:Uma2 family endonuclease
MTTETQTIPVDLNREYSVEEYARLEDDGNLYELIEGKLVMTPVPRRKHARISDNLTDAIRDFLKKNPGIGEAWSHTGFNIGKKPNGKDNVLAPDVGFIIASRIPADDEVYLPYPDLAIEVWSPQSDLADANKLKKARQKLQLYLKAGTRLAWGINSITQQVEVYHPGESASILLSIEDELDGEDVIPGFKLAVRELFR